MSGEVDYFSDELPAEGPIWVIYGHRVFPINAWRRHGYLLIATIPGSPEPQMMEWRRGCPSVWPSELIACQENLVEIDAMRRLYDDLAERAIRSIERIKRGNRPAAGASAPED